MAKDKEKKPDAPAADAAAPAPAPEAAAAPPAEANGAPAAAEAAPAKPNSKTEAADIVVKTKKKPGVPPRRGKKLRNHLKNVEKKLREADNVSVKQAVAELKKLKRAKFDETVEVHMNLGIDVTQSDQMIRGAIPLPHGIGKSVRVAVFAQGDNAAKAKAAGADVVGAADLVEKITKENFLDFDVAIATQDMMGVVSRLGKVLGPRGLMPTPKAGTVTMDVGRAVRESKAGKIEFRVDKSGNVHAAIGKASFALEALETNFGALMDQIVKSKPASSKGIYVRNVSVSSTMGPGVRVDATPYR
jgi:large subunit ribosomal protein L1